VRSANVPDAVSGRQKRKCERARNNSAPRLLRAGRLPRASASVTRAALSGRRAEVCDVQSVANAKKDAASVVRSDNCDASADAATVEAIGQERPLWTQSRAQRRRLKAVT
jgi:hypothetical protein